jgi:hypothetical protein
MKEKKKKSNNKIYIFLFGLILAIVSAEVILGFIGPDYYQFNNQSAEYYTNPRGYHILIRKENGKNIYGLNYLTNIKGYRVEPARVIDSNPRAKQKQIIALGDSFTFGRGVKYEDIYLTKLQKKLQENKKNYQVKNCGIVGADIDEILSVYRFESPKTTHSLVLYGFVLNDFGLPGKEQIVGSDFIDINNGQYTFNPVRRISRIYNLFCYLQELNRINKITKSIYKQAFKAENAAQGFGKLLSLNKMVKKNDSRLVIIIFPLLYDFDNYPFTDIHKSIKEFCARENIPVLDLLPSFSKHKAKELWVNPTDQHPNEIAHDIAANVLFDFLKNNNLLD